MSCNIGAVKLQVSGDHYGYSGRIDQVSSKPLPDEVLDRRYGYSGLLADD